MNCANVKPEIKEVMVEAARLEQMEKEGMLLAPEEQDYLTQIEEVAGLSEVSNGPYKTNVPLTAAQVQALNNIGLKRGNEVVRVLGGKLVDGNPIATISYKGKVEYNRDLNKLQAEGSVNDAVRYGSGPNTKVGGKFVELLRTAKANSSAEMEALLDKLQELSGMKAGDAHYEQLKKVLKNVLGAATRAIPEMAIYLDETASVNDGYITVEGDKGIYLKVNSSSPRFGNEQSAAEIYVHELVHAATVYAMTQMKAETSRYISRLVKLHREAMKVITVEDLLPEVSIDKQAEMKIAQERWDYINTSVEEFLAYALTHEGVINKLKDIKVYENKKPEKLLDRAVYYFKKLLDMALMKWRKEDRTTTGDIAIQNIMLGFIEAQNRANTKVEANIVDVIADKVTALEDYLADKQEEFGKKQVDKLLALGSRTGKSTWEKAQWLSRALVAALTRTEATGALEQLLSAIWMKPEGTVQMLVAGFKKGDEYSDMVEQLGLWSVQVDAERENTARKLTSVVNQMFKKPLKAKQKAALQVVLQTYDGALLLAEDKDAMEYYTNEQTRLDKIAELEKELEKVGTVEEVRWYMHQIDGLVEYMTTGVGTEVQLKNATAIAMRLGTKAQTTEVNTKVKELVDKLTSLKAIEKIDVKTKQVFEELTKVEAEAVVATAKLQKGTEEYLSLKRTLDDTINTRKGYVRETYDSYVTSAIAPIGDRKLMEKRGYKLESRLPVSKFDLGGEEMGLYVSRDMIRQPFNRSGVRFTGDKQHGRTLFENALKSNDSRAGKSARDSVKAAARITKAINDAIMQGKAVQLEKQIMPEYTADGRIVEYRYNVTMAQKKQVGLELDVAEAIGRSWAHQLDVERSEELNAVIWDEMMLDMAANKGLGNISKLGKEYIAIDVHSKSAIMRDIARILPPSYRKMIKEVVNAEVDENGMVYDELAKRVAGSAWDRMNLVQQTKFKAQLGSRKIAVRRDMLIPLFGMRDLSLVEAGLVKHLPVVVKTFIRKLENLWKEFVGLYKVDVVIKTLPVLIGNIVSNFMLTVIYGANPIKVMDDTLKAWEELNIYRETSDRIIELKARKAVGDKVEKEIARLEMAINQLSIKPMIDAGLYTQIMEELDPKNMKASNRIASWIDEKMENWPELVKDGAHWMYVTEKTKLFQVVHAITAKSDFVARYAQFQASSARRQKQREKKLGRKLTDSEYKSMQKDVLIEVRDAFINYAKPDSPLLQYLNDMGLVLFTKYAVRIQRIGMELVSGRPIRAAAAMLGLEFMHDTLGWEPDTILDKNLLLGDKSFMYMPDFDKMLGDVVTPQMLTNISKVL